MKWVSNRGPFGAQLQAGMPNKPRAHNTAGRSIGLFMRGVVTAFYTYDSEGGYPTTATAPKPNAVYVDVLCYGRHQNFLRGVLWTSDRSGLQEGDINPPRPTSFSTQGDLDLEKKSNPAAWDGDHVIVGFLEDNLGLPFVVRSIPHPSSDIGNDEKDIGHRLRLEEADGTPRFWKHRGCYFGVDDAGNWITDLTLGHAGGYQADGKEPAPALSGASGNYDLNVPSGATVTITHDGGTTVTVTDGDITITNSGDTTINTDGKVHLGTAADEPLVQGNLYKSDITDLLNDIKAGFDEMKAYIEEVQKQVKAATEPLAMPPTLDPGALAYFNAIKLVTVPANSAIYGAASSACSDYISGIDDHLSDDVDTK